jgi:hypothetical protein
MGGAFCVLRGVERSKASAMRSINWKYLLFLLVSICAGVAVGVYGKAFLHDNKEARDVIVMVFTILAGFLIAVMTLLGDQSVLPGAWRIAEVKRQAIRAKLIQQKWMFYLYLITLSMIFACTILGKKWPAVTDVVERIYFGFATTAFLLSFRLPSVLMEVQMDRVEAVVGARRQNASQLDRS